MPTYVDGILPIFYNYEIARWTNFSEFFAQFAILI